MNSIAMKKYVLRTAPIVILLAGLAAALMSTAAGCTLNEWGGGGEGDRCNPLLSHDECGSGLQCTQPAFCPENYCCPANGTSSNPVCQPGCNGGAASICTVDMDPDACAFARGTTPEAGGGVTSDAGAGGATDGGGG
jgi:hypothetical protein